jgi:hypothetical protein
MTDLGTKHECSSCGTKFYDLGRSELVCPRCGTDQKELAEDAEGPGATPRRPPVTPRAKAAPPEPVAETDKEEDEAAGDLEVDQEELDDDEDDEDFDDQEDPEEDPDDEDDD